MDAIFDNKPSHTPETPNGLRFVLSELSLYRHSQEWWNMSKRITEGLLDGSIDVERGEQIIKDTQSVRKSYPTLEVPQTFTEKRPNVVFVPLSTSWCKPSVLHTAHGVEPWNPFGDLHERLSHSNIKNLRIRNLEELKRAWLVVLPLVNTPSIHPEHAKQVLSQLTLNTYLANLELYRLTKDASGTTIQFIQNERELLNPFLLEEFGPWLRTLPDAIQDIARKKHITFWFRKDARDMQPWFPQRKPSIKTIYELETNHLIALDTAEDSAIVAISK